MKILTVVGARPQFVKAAALSRELTNHKNLEEVIVHTGQHFDEMMSEIFFQEMQIPKPKYNLNINSLQHGAMTGKMLEGIEKIILDEKPDVLLVYGDTNSTLAGALAAKKLHVKVAHVEAGLRSFNMRMPEEINRILTDRISDILFCPTNTSITNLEREGFANFDIRIIRSGDIMQDAALFYSKKSAEKSNIIKDINLSNFILATIHRAENTDDPDKLKNIISALNEINDSIPVILPLHPRTKNLLGKYEINTNIRLIDPVGYFDMIELLKHCDLVMTDSGGVQKEAFFFQKPCVTLREQTEWVELVENGFNWIVGHNKTAILNGFKEAIDAKPNFNIDLYGKGNAANIIVTSLIDMIQDT